MNASPTQAAPPGLAVLLLAGMLMLAPAVGVPSELMLQDTLKSIVVSGLTLAALAAWAWQMRSALSGAAGPRERGGAATHSSAPPLIWHAVLALPLLLCAYAWGSMAWSHTYLAGVEAVRWAVWAALLWLGLQVLTPVRTVWLAWGIHAGAVWASVWAAAQFWFDLSLFPQGPNPASTFINRNFLAEYLVCTLPYSVWLLARLVRGRRATAVVALMAATLALNLTALLMTGTRAALLATALLGVTGGLLWFWRQTFHYRRGQELDLAKSNPPAAGVARGIASPGAKPQIITAAVTLALVLGVLGQWPTGNAQLLADHQVEGRGLTPLARSWVRAASATDAREYTERSFSLRWRMWRDTARMVAAHPIAGVGAGAWEVQAPLYQTPGSQLETDYYVHNEPLQLVAEYGVVGWAFLLGLLAYLARSAWATWRIVWPQRASMTHSAMAKSNGQGDRGQQPDGHPAVSAEPALRLVALASLTALLVVSLAGFPWRMATTGALFMLGLAVLAASDARLPPPWRPGVLIRVQAASRRFLAGVLAAAAIALLAWAVITQQAARAEHLLVSAVKTALTISASGQPHDPRWAATRAEMLEQVRQGVAINPHYRKITPMVADELARWGDWPNATWIWDSIVQSRPYITAMLTNIARGHVVQGDYDQAQTYLKRSQALQPDAPAVRSLEVILLVRTQRIPEAVQKINAAFDQGIADTDLVSAAINLGHATQNPALVLRAQQQRIQHWPDQAADAWYQMARQWADPRSQVHDTAKAQHALDLALTLATPEQRAAILKATAGR